MRNDTVLALMLLASVLLLFVVTTKKMFDKSEPEWYKYKVTVTEDNGVLMYGVETWDGVYLGEVPACKIDSLVNNYNY